jgi:membrane protein YdbS with pleckstrin-like domain
MNEPVVAPSNFVALPGGGDNAAQETDVWWGSYSGWTMLPSLLICIALTLAIIGGAWTFVERRHLQWTIWSLVGTVWLVQGTRWALRVFGHTYRLTTRRLFIQRGHFWQRRFQIKLADVQQVKVKRSPWSRWTGVGRIVIFPAHGASPVALEGVRQPEHAAARIWEVSLLARHPAVGRVR